MSRSSLLNAINILMAVLMIAALGTSILLIYNGISVASSIRVGEPSINSSVTEVGLYFPVRVSNSGPFTLSRLRMSASLIGAQGNPLIIAHSPSYDVSPGTVDREIVFPMILNLSEIPGESLSDLLEQRGNLTIQLSAMADLTPLVSVNAVLIVELPLDAMLHMYAFETGLHNSTDNGLALTFWREGTCNIASQTCKPLCLFDPSPYAKELAPSENSNWAQVGSYSGLAPPIHGRNIPGHPLILGFLTKPIGVAWWDSNGQAA